MVQLPKRNRRLRIPSSLLPLIEDFLLSGWTVNRWYATDGPEHATGFAFDSTPRVIIRDVLGGAHLSTFPNVLDFVRLIALRYPKCRFDVEDDHVHVFMSDARINDNVRILE